MRGRTPVLPRCEGRARRYPSQVAPFLGLPDEITSQDWADAAELVGVGHTAALMRPDLPIPEPFKLVQQFDLVQLVAPESFGAEDPAAVVLGVEDVPEMLALTELTEPGPFRTRTIEFGGYLGLRSGQGEEGKLIAMAGERFRPPGYVEISAVCTDPAYRGKGLATRLVRAAAAAIERTGARPFLHTGGTNTTAIRLYEGLGFTVSNRMKVTIVEPVAA
ncbi:GNAT family N-acetyltransferase [Kribbella qitaiheensis]|uniref:GNAT family N-acetyltransferase n=1 Tax=Kribbella qitaiheensis TaxID=1544730 RepID=UPI001FE292C0|nr:GNAT family N-acetyltransferase [Kribbella qitaiheensis]